MAISRTIDLNNTQSTEKKEKQENHYQASEEHHQKVIHLWASLHYSALFSKCEPSLEHK